MICRIRTGSLTTDSLSSIGLRLATSASASESVTVQPWNKKSPVSSCTNTAGQWSPFVPGSMPTKRSVMGFSFGGLRNIAPFECPPTCPCRQEAVPDAPGAILRGSAAPRGRCVSNGAAVLVVAACSSSSGPAASASPAVAAPSSPAATGSCGLKTSFDYLVRTTQPGMPASAQEIGNVDLAHCMPTIQDFAKTAGTASGECTQIALASDNPGYDVNASPTPTLRKVITDTGPGC